MIENEIKDIFGISPGKAFVVRLIRYLSALGITCFIIFLGSQVDFLSEVSIVVAIFVSIGFSIGFCVVLGAGIAVPLNSSAYKRQIERFKTEDLKPDFFIDPNVTDPSCCLVIDKEKERIFTNDRLESVSSLKGIRCYPGKRPTLELAFSKGSHPLEKIAFFSNKNLRQEYERLANFLGANFGSYNWRA